ncbi:hypothetical protein Ddc_05898 [Ditylenchus destructor]|nr:hypothetical protein Ddc_05898 [Ditylenchus destructor]
MGEQQVSATHNLLLKIYPFRKYIWAISSVLFLLALVIILHSALIIVGSGGITRVGDPMFIVFSEVLAWMLILLSLVGFKAGCMATDVVAAANRPANCPLGAQNQNNTGLWDDNFIEPDCDNFDIPGTVLPGSSDFIYPPPPPRYSALGARQQSRPQQNSNSRRVNRGPSLNSTELHIQSGVNTRPPVQRSVPRPTPNTTNLVISILSPPPPYVTN